MRVAPFGLPLLARGGGVLRRFALEDLLRSRVVRLRDPDRVAAEEARLRARLPVRDARFVEQAQELALLLRRERQADKAPGPLFAQG